MQPDRRPHGVGHRLAIGTGDHEGQIVGGLGHGQPFDIGPRQAGAEQTRALARRHVRVVEGLKTHVFRRRQRLCHVDQMAKGEAGPRHDHRPGLHTAVAIDPLLKLHLFQQIIDGDGHLLFDFAVDLDLPRPDLESLRGRRDRLGGAELIEIIVGRVDFLGRHRPSGILERRIDLHGIQTRRRIGRAPNPATRYRRRSTDTQRCNELPPVEKHVLRRRQAFRDFPAVNFLDQHLLSLPGNRPFRPQDRNRLGSEP